MNMYKEFELAFTEIKKFLGYNIIIFRTMDYNNLSDIHYSLVAYIRNNLLTADSNLYNLFIKSGIFEKDDMSSFIIKYFYIYINNK